MGRMWLDDEFSSHPKLLALGTRDDRWTWLEILIYTCKQSSPVIPVRIRDVIAKATPRMIEKCVEVGLIDVDPDGTRIVHDWHEYQGSVEERVAAYLARHGAASANEVQQAVAGKREAVLAAVKWFREQYQNGSEGGSLEPPKPVPTDSGSVKELPRALPVSRPDGPKPSIQDQIDQSLKEAS